MPAFDDGQTETELPHGTVSTDVVIVGSGPAGGAAALALATLGVPSIMITKYRWTANTPRAHITNQRAMEIFRDFGVEDQVLAFLHHGDEAVAHLVADRRAPLDQ